MDRKPPGPPSRPDQRRDAPTQMPDRPRVVEDRLPVSERRERMLREAERTGHTTEAIAMLALVRSVDGFLNMGAVYATPSRNMIDAERARGAKDEGHARARAWSRLREKWESLDREMVNEEPYARTSDWIRLFSVLKKSLAPPSGVPSVFEANEPADRATFRKWAESLGLNGDGIVQAVRTFQQMYEQQNDKPFDAETAADGIRSLTQKDLDGIIRAGFDREDVYIHSQGVGFVPLETLLQYLSPSARAADRKHLDAEKQRLQLDPAATRKLEERYYAERYGILLADRNSTSREFGLTGGVFASVTDHGGSLVGAGYHGIIQPDLVDLLGDRWISEQRSRPFVDRHEGKTVVTVSRWVGPVRTGIPLLESQEEVTSPETRGLENAATKKIADAIVYGIEEKVPAWVAYPDRIQSPFYWDNVQWAYKDLIETRLPFLTRVTHIDPAPLERFAGDEAQKDWMYAKIMSSGVTSDKQLDDKRDHFQIHIRDVFPEEAERVLLEQADRDYPTRINMGGNEFRVSYEWKDDGSEIKRAVIRIEGGHGMGSNASRLSRVSPRDLPRIGTAEHPIPLVFTYNPDPQWYRESREYPSDRFGELLREIEPNDTWLKQRWYDFERTDAGKLRIPLTITARDHFPTQEEFQLLLKPHPESVVYVTDRDGIDRNAYATIEYRQGDMYEILYVDSALRARVHRRKAEEKHQERQAALKKRELMGQDVLEKEFATVRQYQSELETYSEEFERDNLVAFVLGTNPYSDRTKRDVAHYLELNDREHAELFLRASISDRQREQELIDAMRKISQTIDELEALGFNWDKYDFNKSTRAMFEDDEYGGGYSRRRDSSGFSPGDIRLHKYEIYRPSMGRQVGHRLDQFRLRDELPQLQRRLEFELEKLRANKQRLQEERQKARPNAETAGPEVVRRGAPRTEDNDEDDR